MRAVALRSLAAHAAVVTVLGLLAPAPPAAGRVVGAVLDDPAPPKPLLTGLLSREGPPPAALAGVVRSWAVKVAWRDLQPTSSGPLDTVALDEALAVARAAGTRIRLRVFAGAQAPAWAKELGGPPVTLTDPFDGKVATVPRFWTPEFGRAYDDLQRQLAGRYDADPVVAEVVVSRCSAFYPEPFLRQTSVAANRTALLAAGYTVELDKACHREQVDAHRAWTTTRSGLAFNPAQLVSPTGAALTDDAFTVEMMTYCRTRLGSRCVLENMSIRSPISSLDQNPAQPRYQRMYDAMSAQGPPLAFQTAVEDRIGDCAATLDWAIARGAASVELPRDPAAAGCSPSTLAAADVRLTAAAPTPPLAGGGVAGASPSPEVRATPTALTVRRRGQTSPRRATLRGRLLLATGARPNAVTLRVQRRTADGRWVRLRLLRTAPDGRFTARLRTARPVRVRVVFPGTPTLAPCRSRVLRIVAAR